MSAKADVVEMRLSGPWRGSRIINTTSEDETYEFEPHPITHTGTYDKEGVWLPTLHVKPLSCVQSIVAKASGEKASDQFR